MTEAAATERRAAIGVWALTVSLHLAYALQYLPLPLVDGPLFDAEVYVAQAHAVAAGRFGDATLLAFSPMYGYVLALLGAASNPVLVIAVQLALGALTGWLLLQLLLRGFGPTAAAFGVLLWGGYGWVAFFETKLLSETLGLCLLASALYLLCGPSVRRAAVGPCLATGACFAFATLARASLLFCLPLVAVGASFIAEAEVEFRLRAKRAVSVACGIGLVLGGYGLWTKVHSGLFVPVILVSETAGHSSQTEWTGDLSRLKPAGSPPPSSWDVVRQAQARLEAVASGRPRADRRAVGVQLAGWLRDAPARVFDTFRNQETTHDYRYYGERQVLPALNLFPITFGFIGVCALIGCGALIRLGRLEALHALWPIVLGTLVTTTLIMPSSRYRLPMVLPLAILGGVGLGWLWDQRARYRQVGLAVVFVVGAGFAYGTMTHDVRHPGLWHVVLAEASLAAKRPQEARGHLADALRMYGDDPVVRRRVQLLGR